MDIIDEQITADLESFYEESAAVALSLKAANSEVLRIASLINEAAEAGNKILVAGNGGSCGDTLHFVGELTCTFKRRDRKAFPAIALNSNQAALTAWVNDFEFETYYSRQVDALGSKDDILFLFSTGGGNRENGFSMNLVYACELAKKKDMKVISLLGKDGGELSRLSDLQIIVQSDKTAVIQQAHITLVHAICEMLE